MLNPIFRMYVNAVHAGLHAYEMWFNGWRSDEDGVAMRAKGIVAHDRVLISRSQSFYTARSLVKTLERFRDNEAYSRTGA